MSHIKTKENTEPSNPRESCSIETTRHRGLVRSWRRFSRVLSPLAVGLGVASCGQPRANLKQVITGEQEQLAYACDVATNLVAEKKARADGISAEGQRALEARAVETSLALAQILGAGPCVHPDVAENMLHDLEGDDTTPIQSDAVRQCQRELARLDDQFASPEQTSSAPPAVQNLLQALALEDAKPSDIVENPSKVARLFNSAWAVVLFARYAARNLDRANERLANSLPWGSGLAQAVLDRLVAEFFAIGVNAVVDELEFDHRIDRAEVSAAACEVLQKGDYDSPVATVVTKRLILRLLDYRTTYTDASEVGGTDGELEPTHMQYDATVLCDDLNQRGAGRGLNPCNRIRTRVHPWRTDQPTAEERAELRKERRAETKTHRDAIGAKRKELKTMNRARRQTTRDEIADLRSARRRDHRDQRQDERWHRFRAWRKARHNDDVSPTLDTYFSIPPHRKVPPSWAERMEEPLLVHYAEERAHEQPVVLMRFSDFLDHLDESDLRVDEMKTALDELIRNKVVDLERGVESCEGLPVCTATHISHVAGIAFSNRVDIHAHVKGERRDGRWSSGDAYQSYIDHFFLEGARSDCECCCSSRWGSLDLSLGTLALSSEGSSCVDFETIRKAILRLEQFQITIGSKEVFGSCSSTIEVEGHGSLHDMARLIHSHGSKIVLVVGYADDNEMTTQCQAKFPGGNDALSRARAEATADLLETYLRDLGVADEEMPEFRPEGLGTRKPLRRLPGETKTEWDDRNRRVDVMASRKAERVE